MTAPTEPSPAQEIVRTLHTLQRWPWWATVQTLYQRFREDRLGLTASSLTFTTIISLVPLATVILAVFSAFPLFAQFQDGLERYFLQSLIPASISQPVLHALRQFAIQAKQVGSVGLAVLVVTALMLMATIDRTLNAIWRVRRMRSLGRRVLVYWSAATMGPIVVGLSLSLASLAFSAPPGVFGRTTGHFAPWLDAAGFALLVTTMSCLYRFVPNTPVRWRHALAGGLFVAIGFELSKAGLALYLVQVPTYSLVYGAFATVPILLIWIYLIWVIVLFGAVIAAYAPSLQMHMLPFADTPGARFRLAVLLLRELHQRRNRPQRGASAEQLARALRVDPLQVEPLLETLTGLDWVGRLAESGGARYVLLCDPPGTPVRPLVALLLLEPAPSVAGFWQRAGFDGLTLQDLLAE